MEKPRFQDAQVGDDVYCRLHGIGIIIDIDKRATNYPIIIRHGCAEVCTYTYSGKYNTNHEEPTLFYRKGSEKYLTERPEPEYEVDWAKVPMGTNVFSSDTSEYIANSSLDPESFFGYFPNLDCPLWTFDTAQREGATGYRYCKLAEPCKPEWRK